MITSNVIDFVAVLRSERERQRAHAKRASNGGSRLLKYRDGIDGLVTVRHAAKILPFETSRADPSA
jgi:hypothetical protein